MEGFDGGAKRAADPDKCVAHDVTRLFVEHYAPLCRYLWRLTGDADVGGDAAQEAFVRLIEKPPVLGVTRAWLFRVGRNAAYDALRIRSKRLRLLSKAPYRAPMGDAPPMPDAMVEAASAREWVRGLLEALTERDRQILVMRGEGFRGREIAEAVGTTESSVATMCARALRKLNQKAR